MENNKINKRHSTPDRDAFLNPADESENESQSTSDRPYSTLDRIGGIDGFMTIVGQIQQAYGLYKQMRPTFQLIGTFMEPKAMVKNVKHKKRSTKKKKSPKCLK